MSFAAKPRAKKPAMKSETSPRRGSAAQAGGGRWERLTQHERERLQARTRGGVFVECLGAGEERQQVHEILFGLLLNRHALLLERTVHRIPEVLAQVRDRDDVLAGLTHRSSPPLVERRRLLLGSHHYRT